LALAAAAAIGLLALDHQSLWSDELGTWRVTVADSWAHWLTQLIGWPNSDAQIPLYHLYMRAWVQVFPATEIALRAANLPWIFMAFLAILSTPVAQPSRRLILLIAAVFLLHPMVWYYADEARPYAMILAGACVAASGMLVRLLNPGEQCLPAASDRRLILGTAMLCGTSIIGVLWSVSFLLPVLPSLVRERWGWRSITRGNLVLAIACALALVPVAVLYASTVIHGISATAFHENSLQSFAFGLYEIAGFSGLGPGREELRVAGAAALAPYAMALVLYGLAVGGALLLGLWSYARRRRAEFFWVLVAALIPLAMLYALGTIKHWRVVGRHMMPLLFFFALFLAHGLSSLMASGYSGAAAIARRACAGLVLAALLASSVEISRAERHQREDFRAAARLAAGMLRAHQRVWWVAQSFGAEYYRLPFVEAARCGAGDTEAVVLLESPRADTLAPCPEPQTIFVGRYDTEGAVGQYAFDHGFRKIGSLTGFEILGK
jgi:hypothetical protein